MDDNKKYYWLDEFGGVNGPGTWPWLQELWSQNIISNETEICVFGEKDWVPYKTTLSSSTPASDCNQHFHLETAGTSTIRKTSPKKNKAKEEPIMVKTKRRSSSKLKISLVVSSAFALLLGITFIWILHVHSRNSRQLITELFKQEKAISIEGSVFIATVGGTNVKLGLVPILICESHNLYTILTMGARSGIDSSFNRGACMQQDNFIIEDYQNCVLKLANLNYTQKEKAWNEFIRGFNSGWIIMKSGWIINPPQIINAVLTDADGKFNIQTKTREKCSLIAIGKRDVFGEKEKYLWIVPLTSEPKQAVMLSNHNLITDFDDFFSVISRGEELLR